MGQHQAAPRYARALFHLAEDTQATDGLHAELMRLRRLIDESAELADFLEHAGLDAQQQRRVLDALFSGRASPLLLRFLNFLVARRRLDLLPHICEAFDSLYCEARGILEAQVSSAVALQPAQVDALRDKLAARYDKRIDITTRTDADLIGGFIVQVHDTVYDYSVKGQLQQLHTALVSA